MVIIAGVIVIVKASASISALMQAAVDSVTKESHKIKTSGPENQEAETKNLI